MELTRLKVNSQYRPCVDEAPYFSWVITSSKKNVMQTSYHITVKNMDEVMWDSGMVESDKSTFVEYNGKPLKSLSDYNWTVEVTVNNGEKAAASSWTQCYFTGLGIGLGAVAVAGGGYFLMRRKRHA